MPGQRGSRSDRAANQLAAAVRADAMQPVVDAVSAECALVRANPSVESVRWEVAVAALATGPKRQHYSAAAATATCPASTNPS